MALVDVRSQEVSCGISWSNEAEALVVRRIIDGVVIGGGIGGSNCAVAESRIAVITPYDAQRQLLKTTLGAGPQVSSVDAYQGREEDLVIVSMTRANDRADTGFAKDPRRLNVALTRARRGLIVVGDINTLCARDTEGILTDFVTECVRRDLLLTGDLKPCHRIDPPRKRRRRHAARCHSFRLGSDAGYESVGSSTEVV